MTIDSALPAIGTLTEAEIDAAMVYAAAEKSPATREAYASDWRDFEAWCAAKGATPLPAHVGIVAAYLSSLAQQGRKCSTVGRRAAAIGHKHRLAGFEPPTNSEGVRAVLRGIRRTIGSAKVQKSPATAEVITSMLKLCDGDTLAARRDRALLLIGFAAALRRSELIGIDVEHITWTSDGIRLLIPRSKTDQEGAGQLVAIPAGTRLFPCRALRDWLDAAAIVTGPVFRSVALGGRVGGRLADDSAARIVKKYAARVGLDASAYSGHSLRAGLITSAAETGGSVKKIMEVSRHRSADVLFGYIRNSDLFKDHCAAGFL
jgi:integrase